MAKLDKTKTKRYMRTIAHNHVDNCGEVNLTALVEDTASALEFDEIGGPLDDPEHDVWAWAIEISESL